MLRVIDENGKQIGVLPLEEALAKAQEAGMDLIEIAPHARPPVAKISKFTKFKYQQEKKGREVLKKQKKGSEVKEIWLTPFIAENDYSVRLGRILEFLKEGHKVRVAVRFRRNQMSARDFGYNLARRVVEATAEVSGIDQQPKFLGNQLVMMLTPVRRKVVPFDKAQGRQVVQVEQVEQKGEKDEQETKIEG